MYVQEGREGWRVHACVYVICSACLLVRLKCIVSCMIRRQYKSRLSLKDDWLQ